MSNSTNGRPGDPTPVANWAPGPAPEVGRALRVFPVYPDGYVEVVGEYYHQAAIETLLRPTLGGGGVSADMHVLLIPEPDNPYDDHAISVRRDGLVLGYLSRADARRYWPMIARIVASGYAVHVLAHMYASKYRSYSDGSVEVSSDIRLRLPEPETVLPLNVEPANGVLLPKGNSLQVLGEEDHFDHLFNYVPAGGEGLLLLELRRGSQQLKNGTVKELVVVFLDGEEVGKLSGQSAGHFTPTIRHLEDFHKKTIVWGKIKGSALSASLTIHGAKSHELSDEWLDAQPTAAFDLVPENPSYELPDAYQGPKRASKPRPARPAPRAAAETPSASMPPPRQPHDDAATGHAPMAPLATATNPKPPGRFSRILMWFALVVGVIGLFIEPVGATMWLLVALITRVFRRRRAANYASRVRRDEHAGWRPMQEQQDEDAESPQE